MVAINPRGSWTVLVLSWGPLDGCTYHREALGWLQLSPAAVWASFLGGTGPCGSPDMAKVCAARAPWQERPSEGKKVPGVYTVKVAQSCGRRHEAAACNAGQPTRAACVVDSRRHTGGRTGGRATAHRGLKEPRAVPQKVKKAAGTPCVMSDVTTSSAWLRMAMPAGHFAGTLRGPLHRRGRCAPCTALGPLGSSSLFAPTTLFPGPSVGPPVPMPLKRGEGRRFQGLSRMG